MYYARAHSGIAPLSARLGGGERTSALESGPERGYFWTRRTAFASAGEAVRAPSEQKTRLRGPIFSEPLKTCPGTLCRPRGHKLEPVCGFRRRRAGTA